MTMQLYQLLNKEGFFESFISTLLNFSGLLNKNLVERYQQVGRNDYPVALFWGKNDRTIPVSCSVTAKEAIPRAELMVWDSCGHVPQVEKREELIAAILDFLKRHK